MGSLCPSTYYSELRLFSVTVWVPWDADSEVKISAGGNGLRSVPMGKEKGKKQAQPRRGWAVSILFT